MYQFLCLKTTDSVLEPLHRCIPLLSGAVIVRYYSWRNDLTFFFKCTCYLYWAGHTGNHSIWMTFFYSRSFFSNSSSICCYYRRKCIECKECSDLHIVISWFLRYMDLNFTQNLKAVWLAHLPVAPRFCRIWIGGWMDHCHWRTHIRDHRTSAITWCLKQNWAKV